MAERQELLVRIDKSGNAKVEVVCGPGGSGCLEMLRPIQEALGQTTETVEKDEMFVTTETAQNVQGS